MNFHFTKPDQLVDFMLNTEEFNSWETITLYVQTSSGLELSMNTRITVASGTEYMQWKKIKTFVKTFWESNPNIGATLDIRMRLPKEIKQNIDANDDFSTFNLTFSIGSNLTMVTNTAVERKLPAPVLPIEEWTTYVSKLVSKYKKDNNIVD